MVVDLAPPGPVCIVHRSLLCVPSGEALALCHGGPAAVDVRPWLAIMTRTNVGVSQPHCVAPFMSCNLPEIEVGEGSMAESGVGVPVPRGIEVELESENVLSTVVSYESDHAGDPASPIPMHMVRRATVMDRLEGMAIRDGVRAVVDGCSGP